MRCARDMHDGFRRPPAPAARVPRPAGFPSRGSRPPGRVSAQGFRSASIRRSVMNEWAGAWAITGRAALPRPRVAALRDKTGTPGSDHRESAGPVGLTPGIVPDARARHFGADIRWRCKRARDGIARLAHFQPGQARGLRWQWARKSQAIDRGRITTLQCICRGAWRRPGPSILSLRIAARKAAWDRSGTARAVSCRIGPHVVERDLVDLRVAAAVRGKDDPRAVG